MSGPLVLIAAVADNGLIGVDGDLPWRLPEDLRRFRALTMGHIVLMGRKTWDSLGKPLPGRDNWVLSRGPDFAPAGARVFHSLDAVLDAAGERPVMVIGGAHVYALTLPLAQRLELTRVNASPKGDTYFPSIDFKQWRETANTPHIADERHAYAYNFVTLERLDPS